MLAVLLSLLSFSPVPQKDSTLLYTIKENEVMVKQKEHKLMITKSGADYIFCTYRRGAGYFVFRNTTSHGPFTSSEPVHEDEPSYWIVGKVDGKYYLDALTGKMTGPFSTTDKDDRGTPYYFQKMAFYPFFVRAVVTRDNSLNINGKIYKTCATGNDSLTVALDELIYLPNGKAKVKYHSFLYLGDGQSDRFERDSIVTAGSINLPVSDDVVIRKATADSDSIFLKGAFVALGNFVEGFFNGKGYDLGPFGDLFYTKGSKKETRVYRNQKLIFKGSYISDFNALRSSDMVSFKDGSDKYYVSADGSYLDEPAPAKDDYYGKIIVWRKKKQWAVEKDGKIICSNGTTYPGIDLEYDAAANSYKWLSVNGRSLYINTVSCE